MVELPDSFLLQLVTLQEAKLLLKEDDDLIKAVYDYWLKKRKRQKGPLVFQVRKVVTLGCCSKSNADLLLW